MWFMETTNEGHISPQEKWICDIWRQQTKATWSTTPTSNIKWYQQVTCLWLITFDACFLLEFRLSLMIVIEFDWLCLMIDWLYFWLCVWLYCLWCLFLIEFLIVFKESIKLFKLVSCFKKTISNLEKEILKLKFEIWNWKLKFEKLNLKIEN